MEIPPQPRRVLAIDPAPGKPSTVFDGRGFSKRNGDELRELLNDPGSRTAGTLVCWDAPLTGPASPASAGKHPDFTQRLIEKFFSTAMMGFKAPKGIAVMPYCQCPHWTISRSLLGLPRTGPYDHDYHELPFHLLPGPNGERVGRASIIEIHPGVAAWLWCRDDMEGPWEYKKDPRIRCKMWSILREGKGFSWGDRPQPENDDQFDVAVGYILGSLYVDQLAGARKVGQGVVSLGDRSTGSFLLPAVPGLKRSWSAFVEDAK